MNERIKTLKIIHLAMVGGVTLAYFIMGDFKNIFEMVIDTNDLLYAFIPALAYVFSNFMFRKMIGNIEREASNEEKLNSYQTASIVRWAIVEGACFLIIILKPDFLLFGVILLIYLILIAPKEHHIYETLNIRN